MNTDKNRNMYGCFPCPKCKARHRAPFQEANLRKVIKCDECGHVSAEARSEDGGYTWDAKDEGFNLNADTAKAELLLAVGLLREALTQVKVDHYNNAINLPIETHGLVENALADTKLFPTYGVSPVTTRDELVQALRVYRPTIVDADEWRPLASHVLALLSLARNAALEEAAEALERRFLCSTHSLKDCPGATAEAVRTHADAIRARKLR